MQPNETTGAPASLILRRPRPLLISVDSPRVRGRGRDASEPARLRHVIESLLLTSGVTDSGRVASLAAPGEI